MLWAAWHLRPAFYWGYVAGVGLCEKLPNGGATVEILAPDSPPNSTRRQNDESLGMKITHGDTSMMRATRSVVPNKARQQTTGSDLLKVAHHGI